MLTLLAQESIIVSMDFQFTALALLHGKPCLPTRLGTYRHAVSCHEQPHHGK